MTLSLEYVQDDTYAFMVKDWYRARSFVYTTLYRKDHRVFMRVCHIMDTSRRDSTCRAVLYMVICGQRIRCRSKKQEWHSGGYYTKDKGIATFCYDTWNSKFSLVRYGRLFTNYSPVYACRTGSNYVLTTRTSGEYDECYRVNVIDITSEYLKITLDPCEPLPRLTSIVKNLRVPYNNGFVVYAGDNDYTLDDGTTAIQSFCMVKRDKRTFSLYHVVNGIKHWLVYSDGRLRTRIFLSNPVLSYVAVFCLEGSVLCHASEYTILGFKFYRTIIVDFSYDDITPGHELRMVRRTPN
jgi:hypothetical protein